jgi:hypothetical protein
LRRKDSEREKRKFRIGKREFLYWLELRVGDTGGREREAIDRSTHIQREREREARDRGRRRTRESFDNRRGRGKSRERKRGERAFFKPLFPLFLLGRVLSFTLNNF